VKSGLGKNNQERTKKIKYNGQQQKGMDCDEPHLMLNEKHGPSSGENNQLVHWWLLVHYGPQKELRPPPIELHRWSMQGFT
jgi:hypothetical protein